MTYDRSSQTAEPTAAAAAAAHLRSMAGVGSRAEGGLFWIVQVQFFLL